MRLFYLLTLSCDNADEVRAWSKLTTIVFLSIQLLENNLNWSNNRFRTALSHFLSPSPSLILNYSLIAFQMMNCGYFWVNEFWMRLPENRKLSLRCLDAKEPTLFINCCFKKLATSFPSDKVLIHCTLKFDELEAMLSYFFFKDTHGHCDMIFHQIIVYTAV